MQSKPIKAGKLPPSLLQSLVFPNLGLRRPEVLVHSSLGEDSTVLDFGDQVAVLSTDPITGASRNQGWLGVHVACNDLAAMGAEPIGVLVTLLLSDHDPAAEAAAVMSDVHRAASELGIEVLGGHSEVTPGLPNTIISLTSVGKAAKAAFVTSAGARPGDALLLTKAAGLEGTAILASDRAEKLAPLVGRDVLERAQRFVGEISVVPEGLAAAKAGATAMHDATEGGVLGAIYELCAASGLGVEVEVAAIPVREETRLICAALGIDPLRLVSSGALVVAAPDSDRVLAALAAKGIPAALVGRLVERERVLITPHGRLPLDPPEGDELWRALGDA
jgi:hydrogenase maturation factor